MLKIPKSIASVTLGSSSPTYSEADGAAGALLAVGGTYEGAAVGAGAEAGAAWDAAAAAGAWAVGEVEAAGASLT